MTAGALALEAHHTGRPVLELIRERGLLSEEALRALISPESLTGVPAP
ncbi:hypothetical protein [Streptomyces sp. NPDC021139]